MQFRFLNFFAFTFNSILFIFFNYLRFYLLFSTLQRRS